VIEHLAQSKGFEELAHMRPAAQTAAIRAAIEELLKG